MTAEETKRRLRMKPEKTQLPDKFVSFGPTLLNLGLTGNTRKGLQAGSYCLVVGDSDTGKSYITLAALAEAAINPIFDDYRLIYNGPENGAGMDIRTHYGPKLEDRLEKLTPGNGASSTVEEFYDFTDTLISNGKPFIQILDSMDALTTDDELGQVAKERKGREENKEVKGSYNTDKPKKNSQRLRVCVNGLVKTGSILIIVSQTRDNIGFGSQFNPKTRAGGKAMRFFAHTEIWMSKKESINKPYKGKQIPVGGVTQIKVQRSRHTGAKRSVEVPIYFSSGIDDVGSMIDFLLEWKYWKGTEGKLTAPEFKFSGSAEDLCLKIDAQDGGRQKLRKVVLTAWREIESAVAVQRRNPYT